MKYTIFFLDTCPFSHAAKEIMDNKNLDYDIYIFSTNLERENTKEVMIDSLAGKYKTDGKRFEKRLFKDFFGQDETFPRIYEGEDLVGGFTDLESKFK